MFFFFPKTCLSGDRGRGILTWVGGWAGASDPPGLGATALSNRPTDAEDTTGHSYHWPSFVPSTRSATCIVWFGLPTLRRSLLGFCFFFFFCLVLNIYFYVFIWLHPVSVVARGMFSGVMGDLFLLSCGMQVLVPWPGIEPGSPTLRSMESQPLDHQESPTLLGFITEEIKAQRGFLVQDHCRIVTQRPSSQRPTSMRRLCHPLLTDLWVSD